MENVQKKVLTELIYLTEIFHLHGLQFLNTFRNQRWYHKISLTDFIPCRCPLPRAIEKKSMSSVVII